MKGIDYLMFKYGIPEMLFENQDVIGRIIDGVKHQLVAKDRTFIDIIKSYNMSDNKDDVKHDTEVESMFYIDKLKHMLVMERDSKRFKVYNSRTGKFLTKGESKVQGKNSDSKPIKHGAIIAADYIEIGNTKLFATTSNGNRSETGIFAVLE
jgi:hypothetical protein